MIPLSNTEELTKVDEVSDDKLFAGLEDEQDMENSPDDLDNAAEMDIENNPAMFNEFGEYIGEVPEIDYATKIRTVLRFETRGLRGYTHGNLNDLHGEYCFIEDYDTETDVLRVSLLGNAEEQTFNLPKQLIERGEYGKLPLQAKEILKHYRKAYNKYESTKRYLSRLFEKIKLCHIEIDKHLKEIHRIGTSTFPQTLESVRQTNEQEYGGFQNGGIYENLSPSSSRGIGRTENIQNGFMRSNGFSSSSTNSFSNRQGPRGLNQSNSSFGASTTFNSPSSPYSRSGNFSQQEQIRKDKEGFQSFEKTLLGKEKQTYKKSKRGKKRKKPTVLLKPNKIYYIKLRTGTVMMIYVKNIEIAPKKYLKQYYSEFGLVEEKEISWFIEKQPNESATNVLKQHYSRVFSLERQIEKLEQKRSDKDAEMMTYAKKRDGYRSILNEYIRKGIQQKEVTKCIRKEITIKFIKEHNVPTLVIRGVGYEVYRVLYSRFKFGMPTAKYEKERELLIIPLSMGARYYEINTLLKELIAYYGHRDRKELRDYVKENLDYYL